MIKFILVLLGIISLSTVSSESPYRPRTTSGVYCKLPFDYNGKSYQDCTTEGSTRPWCYTSDTDWDYCVDSPDFSKCDVANPSANASEIELIVQLLNNMRAKEPAIRMAKLKWNSELAMRSQFMSNLCDLGNANSKLCSFDGSMGQISFMTMSSEPQNPQWMQFLLEFYNKKASYDFETNKCSVRYCNGYKQLVNAETVYVGCAKTSCKKNSLYADYYFCNFYPPIYSGRPFEKGTGRCDSCFKLDDTQKFRCNKDLCEMCDIPNGDCQGKEQLVRDVESGKICEDVRPSFCKVNEGVCQYIGLLPDKERETLTTHCKKTCKMC